MEEEKQFGINDALAIVKRRFWWILIPALLGPAVGFGVTYLVRPVYTSKALVFIEQPKVPDKFVPQLITDQLDARLVTLKEQILSRSRLEPIVRNQGLFKDSAGSMSMDEMVERLRKSIDVQMLDPAGGTGIPSGFYIKASADSARTAQRVCTEILSLFMAENMKARYDSAQGTTEFLSGQLEQSKNKLDAQDAKLAEFKQKYLGQLPTDEQSNLELLTATRARLEAVNQELSQAEQQKIVQESTLTQLNAREQTNARPVMIGTSGVTPSDLERELTDLRSQLVAMQARYTDQHPDVVKIKAQIQALQNQLKASNSKPNPKTIDTNAVPSPSDTPVVDTPEQRQLRVALQLTEETIRSKRTEQASLGVQVKNLEARLQLSPLVEEQYKALTRDYDTALVFYNDLLTKKKQSEEATDLEKRQEGEQFGIMDAPDLPANPTFPNRMKFGLGGLGAGLALGLGLAFFHEQRENFIRSGEDAVLILGLPVLGELPDLAFNPNAKTKATPHGGPKRREEAGEHRPAKV